MLEPLRRWRPRLRRQGNDLHVVTKLTLQEALVGFARRLTLPDDSTLSIEVSGVTAHQGVKVIAGGGMPRAEGDGGMRGDLHLHTRVLFPKKLSAQQRAFFESLDA